MSTDALITELGPFSIAKTPVSNAEYFAFIVKVQYASILFPELCQRDFNLHKYTTPVSKSLLPEQAHCGIPG